MSRAKSKLVVYEGDMGFNDIDDTTISPKDLDFTDGIPTGESMLIGTNSLGTTVGDFMKNLTKEERIILRQMVDNKEVTFKCR